MVDDFMVCVDRIIASACFERVNEDGVSVNRRNGEGSSCNKEEEEEEEEMKKLIECRICQEEDQECELEAPCGCNGTLKFAHRKCIQRWCNKKGNITCEICNQVYQPNYSIPPPRAGSDGMAIDIRQSWSSRIDLHDPHFLALAAAEHQFLRAEYEDYAVANTGGIACCRSVALILMLLLFVRHALMVTRDSGIVQDSSIFFNVSLLQIAGFLLPCFVMGRSWYILYCRRRRQV